MQLSRSVVTESYHDFLSPSNHPRKIVRLIAGPTVGLAISTVFFLLLNQSNAYFYMKPFYLIIRTAI